MQKTILTHSGSFQADDIFAVAILLMVAPESNVVRSREQDDIARADYVVDVGMVYDPARNRFDHHQPGGAGERLNGIPYASCGLVWKEYGEKLSGGKEVADLIDGRLMAPLDAIDNGVAIAESRFKNIRMYSVIDFLYSYIPSMHESEESLHKIFMQLVGVAKELLTREIANTKRLIDDETKALNAYDKSADKRVVVLDDDLMWHRVFRKKPEILFVVYHRNEGNWGLETVQEEGFVSRKKLPNEWGGKTGKELQEVTGVSDAVFCHRALFFAVAESKEGAIKLAQKCL